MNSRFLRAMRNTTPERLTLLGSALIVALSATLIAVTLAYRSSAEAERRRAERGAIGVVNAVQGLFTDQALRSGAGMLLEIFAPAFSIERSHPEIALKKMQQRLADYASDCSCTPMPPSAMLIIDTDGRVHEAKGSGLRPATAGALKEIRRIAAVTKPRVREYRAIEVDIGEPAIAYIHALQHSDSSRYVAAIIVPASEMGATIFEPTRRDVAARLYPEIAGRDSLFGITVTLRDDTIYTSPWSGEGPNASVRFWTRGNPMLVSTLVLNPAIMSAAIPGGIPQRQDGLIFAVVLLLVVIAAVAVLALQRARKLMAARTLFLTGVSHELRTPLTQVLIYAERLTRVDGDSILRERAREVIVREARRLVHMIENVLLFSRSGSTRLPMNLRVESVGDLVTAAMADLEPLLASRQVSAQIAIAPETDALVDPGAVRQIVFNLIDNAIRYGPQKQTLHINVMRNGSCVELSVDDDGPGIPVADRRRIWKPFRTQGRNRGTGIGLPLVRRLAIEMGGGAAVLDGTRGGARVRVWFGLSPNGGPKRNIDARHAAGASR